MAQNQHFFVALDTDYKEMSQTFDIDKTFNSTPRKTTWDRKVVWGFTGSNGLKGNSFGAMVTKLPQEPEVEVERQVRNVTKNETQYRTETVGDAGDVLEYKVKVTNKVVDSLDIPLKRTKVVEDLESNTFVSGSFNFSNSQVTGTAIQPTAKPDGDNKFSFLDEKYSYAPGDSFEYSYRVEIDEDTTEFINEVAISSTYSTEQNYGETTVYVLPKDLQLNKQVDAGTTANPIVGDVVTVTSELTVSNGLLLMDEFTDSLPAGFELVAGSTKIYDKGSVGPHEMLADAEVWSGDQLVVKRSPAGWPVAGSNTMVVEYKIKPTETVKGQEVVLPKATAAGTNQYSAAADKKTYSATSNETTITVKTDLTVNFLDAAGVKLADEAWIISSNSAFNGKNPVKIYYNTGDTYDYSTVIEEISQKLLANQQLTFSKVEGDVVSSTAISGVVKAAGNKIDVYYTSDAVLTIKFINEAGSELSGYTVKLDRQIGDVIYLPAEAAMIEAFEKVTGAGFEIVKRPADEAAVTITKVVEERVYEVRGLLFLQSAPADIDFGVLTYDAKIQRVDDPDLSDKLVVADTRADKSSGWELSVKVDTPMTNTAGGSSAILVDALRYVSAVNGTNRELTLSSDLQKIYSDTSGADSVSVSDEWGTSETDLGLKLVVDPRVAQIKNGTYTGEITWQIMAGTP